MKAERVKIKAEEQVKSRCPGIGLKMIPSFLWHLTAIFCIWLLLIWTWYTVGIQNWPHPNSTAFNKHAWLGQNLPINIAIYEKYYPSTWGNKSAISVTDDICGYVHLWFNAVCFYRCCCISCVCVDQWTVFTSPTRFPFTHNDVKHSSTVCFKCKIEMNKFIEHIAIRNFDLWKF